jgi:hypothetical protein
MSLDVLTFGVGSQAANWEQLSASTSDNTATTLSSMAVQNDSAGDLIISATAVRISDMSRKSWFFFGSFKKVGAGNIKVELKKIAEIGDEHELRNAEFEVKGNGSNIDLVGTGLDDTPMGWIYTCRGYALVNP